MPANIAARVFLIRHGETTWSLGGKHASVSEIPLSKEGEAQVEEARKSFIGAGKLIEPENISRVYVSPQQRTHRTAEILQLGVHRHQHFVDRETNTITTTGAPGPQDGSIEGSIQSTTWLQEWNYGEYEGLTIADIRNRRGQTENEEWSIWKEGCPGGETPEQVSDRLDLLISEIREAIGATAASWPGGQLVAHATGLPRDIVCIGHGHILAALAMRWAGQPVRNGMRLLMEPASVAILGFEHDDLAEPAILLGRRVGVGR